MLRNTITSILLMLTIASCGHSKLDELETQIASLEDEVVVLKKAHHNVCMMAAEMSGGGLMMYLGDNIWVNQMTGQVAKFPSLDEDCEKAMGQFIEVVTKRAEIRAAAEERLAQEPLIVK